MRYLAISLFLRPALAALARLREIRRRRKVEVALKNLPQHLLNDIGQGHYRERIELDQDQIDRIGTHARW